MKRFFYLSILIIILSACKKDNTIIEETALTPPVNNFRGEYTGGGINLTWSYSYTGQINYYILYYSPGGENNDTINAYQTYYQIPYALRDTNYLFNIRVVDKKENFSQASVVYVSTY